MAQCHPTPAWTAESVVGNQENRPRLDLTFWVHVELTHTVTKQLNKTARNKATWSFLGLMVLNFTQASVFGFLDLRWLHDVLLVREAAGTGCEHGSCCALVCPPPAPCGAAAGVGWWCAGLGVTQEESSCYLASAVPAWEEEVGEEGACLCDAVNGLRVMLYKAAFITG